MTKERKLAIKMWEEIKQMLPFDENLDISIYKRDFCLKHNLKWHCSCWFCQYFNWDCKKCPLKDCLEDNSIYCIVTNKKLFSEDRIKACDRIINALKGVN